MWVAASALALPLAGCGGGGSDSSPSASTPTAPVPLSASATLPDGLTATLTQDRATVPVGGSVTYTLTLVNATGQPVVYQSTVGCGVTNVVGQVSSIVTVVNAAGQTVYPPQSGGSGCGAEQAPLPVTVAAGQTLTGTVTTGNVFPGAGHDTATATLYVQSTPGGTFQTTTVGPLTVSVQ